MSKLSRLIAACALLAAPALVAAHEVYVLDASTVAAAIAQPSRNPFLAYVGNEGAFFFWGFISILTVSTIFCVTLFHLFEQRLAPILRRLKRYTHPTLRITASLALISFAYHGALFGPELPLASVYGNVTALVGLLLYLAGFLILVGYYTRIAALGAFTVALVALGTHGSYLLVYTTYYALCIFLIGMGSGNCSLDRAIRRGDAAAAIESFRRRFEPYALPLVRVAFGFSVVAAACFAKFLHSNLALQTVMHYDITRYFPFDPLFVVLGAFIIESLIGIFIMLGIALRWTALFFLFWLTLSLLYFGEAAWPHIALFGLNIAIVCHGYDRLSLEGWLMKRGSREPVL